VAGDFDGVVVAVTGGGSGVGLATGRLLAARGARVAALDLDPAAAAGLALPVTADVTDDDSVRAAVASVVERFGALDVLVNAVLALTLAANHVAEGIQVNCAVPGTADTPWVRRLLDATPDPERELAALRARQPAGRLVSAEEVTHAIAYLASPLAPSTVGTALAVDGGMQGLRLPADRRR
jgi:NAD(P)-dependent dehydrogenase (short-subunit alcohol dehydrogenase family)